MDDEEQRPAASAVRIEGVPFTLDQAREFARRTRICVGVNAEAMTPGTALAVALEHAVENGGGRLHDPSDEEVRAALAVIDEWLQSSSAPRNALLDLRRVLSSRG
jgi:hypothetical protein